MKRFSKNERRGYMEYKRAFYVFIGFLILLGSIKYFDIIINLYESFNKAHYVSFVIIVVLSIFCFFRAYWLGELKKKSSRAQTREYV
jgi:uncharacterized membrane protein